MRKTFVDTLTKLARQDNKIMLVIGDTGFSVFEAFEREFGERFVNVGIAEQNFISFSAGLAAMGYKPFAYNVVSFMTMRSMEQIFLDVCYQENPVVMVGVGGGFAYGPAGPTHHSLSDIAMMCAIPNLQVICPCDPVEMEEAVICASQTKVPMYIRIGRSIDPVVHTRKIDFKIGKAVEIRPGKDIAIFAAGTMVKDALSVCDLLEAEGISASLYSMHTIKPLDYDTISECADKYDALFTIEEHSVVGGLGAKAAAYLKESVNSSVKFKAFAVRDEFAPVTGSREYLLKLNGLDPQSITDSIKEVVNC